MIGAILGDIVGSRFEYNNIKTKDFELFDRECFFTDDSVMTIAVAKALMEYERIDKYNVEDFKKTLINVMHEVGRKYPDCGYGGHFRRWIMNNHTEPYNSFGNGSAMRVSSVGWYAKTIDEAEFIARATAPEPADKQSMTNISETTNILFFFMLPSCIFSVFYL